MASPSVISGIKSRFEGGWIPEATGQPALPLCPCSKLHVRAADQAIQLKPRQERYLYGSDELTRLINCIAEG